MKKIAAAFAAFLILFNVLSGCAQTGAPAAHSASGKKLKVYASFYAMYDLTKKVGGDRVDLASLVPAGTEPHDWQPSSTDVVHLEQADILVYNGDGMENWAGKVLSSLQNKKLVAVEASKGIAPEKSGGTEDPHIWLAPENAKKEMANIRDALIRADPAGKSVYEANDRKYASKFDALDREYRSQLSSLPKKDIVVSHQAFGYLCRAYGLRQIPIEGLSASTEPDPKRMTEIISFVKKNGIKYIFFEDLVSPKVAQSIAAQTGAQTLQLNPLEGLTAEAQAKGEDYFSVMEQNLQALKKALSA